MYCYQYTSPVFAKRLRVIFLFCFILLLEGEIGNQELQSALIDLLQLSLNGLPSPCIDTLIDILILLAEQRGRKFRRMLLVITKMTSVFRFWHGENVCYMIFAKKKNNMCWLYIPNADCIWHSKLGESLLLLLILYRSRGLWILKTKFT